jgi:hypothetical protein
MSACEAVVTMVGVYSIFTACGAQAQGRDDLAVRRSKSGLLMSAVGSIAPNRLARDAGGMSALLRKRPFASGCKSVATISPYLAANRAT